MSQSGMKAFFIPSHERIAPSVSSHTQEDPCRPAQIVLGREMDLAKMHFNPTFSIAIKKVLAEVELKFAADSHFPVGMLALL